MVSNSGQPNSQQLLLYSVLNTKITSRWRKTKLRFYSHIAYNLVKGTYEKNNQFSQKIIIELLEYFASWWQNPCARKINFKIILEKASYLSGRGTLVRPFHEFPLGHPQSPSAADAALTTPLGWQVRTSKPTCWRINRGGGSGLTDSVSQKPLDLFPGLGHHSPRVRCLAPALIPTSTLGRFNIRTGINPIFPIRKFYLQFLNLILLHLRRVDGCSG